MESGGSMEGQKSPGDIQAAAQALGRLHLYDRPFDFQALQNALSIALKYYIRLSNSPAALRDEMFEADFIRPLLREVLLPSCMRGYFTELAQLTPGDHIYALQAVLLMTYLTGQILSYYWRITGQFVPCLPTWMRLDIFGLLTMLTHLISVDSPFVQYHCHSPAYGMHLTESEDIAPQTIEPVQYMHVTNAIAHLSRSGGLTVLLQALQHPARLGLSALSTFLLFFRAAVPFLACSLHVSLLKSINEVISYLERCFEAAEDLSAFDDEDCSASLSDPPLPHMLISSILSTCSRIGHSLGVGDSVDDKVTPLQQELVLRLLKSGNFTRQLAAVKDLDQVILASVFDPDNASKEEDVNKARVDGLMHWMHSNDVVKLMLSSNLHQHSYAEAAVKVLATLIRHGQLDDENGSELEPLWAYAKDASTFDEIRSNACVMLGILFPLLPSEPTLRRLIGPDGLDPSSALHVLGSIPSLAKSKPLATVGQSPSGSEKEKAERVIDAICDVLLDDKAASIVSTFHTLEQACLRHSTPATLPELVGKAMGRCIQALQGEYAVAISAAILLNRLLTVVVPTVRIDDPKCLYGHMKLGKDKDDDFELLDVAMDVTENWVLVDERKPPISGQQLAVGAFMRLLSSIIVTRLSTVGERHLCRVLQWAQSLGKFPSASAACWELLTVLLHGTARRQVMTFETARNFLCNHLCTVAPTSVVGSAAWTCLVAFMASVSNWDRDLLITQSPRLLINLITSQPGPIWDAERSLLSSLMLKGEESVSAAACDLLSELVACRAREQSEREQYLALLCEYTNENGTLMRDLVQKTEEIVGLAVGKNSHSPWYVCISQQASRENSSNIARSHILDIKRYLRFLERLVCQGILVGVPHGRACKSRFPSQRQDSNLTPESPAALLAQQGTVYRVAMALAQLKLPKSEGDLDAQAWRLLEALPTSREALHDVTCLLNDWWACAQKDDDGNVSTATLQVRDLLASGPAVVLRYMIETMCILVNAQRVEGKTETGKSEMEKHNPSADGQHASIVAALLQRVNPGEPTLEATHTVGPPHIAVGIHISTLTLLSTIFAHPCDVIPVNGCDAKLAGQYAKSLIISTAAAAAASSEAGVDDVAESSSASNAIWGSRWNQIEPANSHIALKSIQLLKLCCFEYQDSSTGLQLQPPLLLLDDAFAHAVSILITLTLPDLRAAAFEFVKLVMTLPTSSAGLHWVISNVLTPVLLGPRSWEEGGGSENVGEEEEDEEEEDEGEEEDEVENDYGNRGDEEEEEDEEGGGNEGEEAEGQEAEGGVEEEEEEEEWSEGGEDTGEILDDLLMEAASRDPGACESLLNGLVDRFKRAVESEGGCLKGIVNSILLLLRVLDRREFAQDIGQYIITRVLYPELILLSEARTSGQHDQIPVLALCHQDAILKSARLDPNCREACVDLLLDLMTHDLSCWNSCSVIIAEALDAGVAALPKSGANRPVPIADGRQNKNKSKSKGRNKRKKKNKQKSKSKSNKKRTSKKDKTKVKGKGKSRIKKRVRGKEHAKQKSDGKGLLQAKQPSRHKIKHRVGLSNGGATCYMNATFQQLFAQPTVRQLILEADIPSSKDENDIPGVFAQVRTMFSRLAGGVEAWYEPRGFWRAFKDYEGNPINIREHQDAYEFFTRLQDAVDETLAAAGQPKAIHSALGGTFVQVITVVGNPELSSQREEDFYQVSVDVRGKKDLLDSLESYVAPELLDGPNRWYCEDLGRKVDAEKRTLIKRLPHTLMVHLKRFEWDHETLTRWKVKDRFEFPIDIDLRPYTLVTGNGDDDNNGTIKNDYHYSLCGVVIHSGTAFAGHYYSYVKDREDGTWYRFDDANVQPWDLSDVEEDCFGGANRPNSAYMLLYERNSTTPSSTCCLSSLPHDLALEVAHHNVVSVATAHILGKEMMGFFDGVAKDMRKAVVGLRPRKLARGEARQVFSSEGGAKGEGGLRAGPSDLGLGLGLARLVSPRTANVDLDLILMSAAELCLQYICTAVARGPYALATTVVPQQRGRAPLPLAINAALSRPAVAMGLASFASSNFLTALTCCHSDVRDVVATWCALLCEKLETGYGEARAVEAVAPLFDALMKCLCSQQNKIANIVGMNLWTWEEVMQGLAGMVVSSDAMGTLVLPYADAILSVLGPAVIQGFWSLKEEDREDYDFGARYLDLLSCLLRRWRTDDADEASKDEVDEKTTTEADINPFCIVGPDGMLPPMAPEGIWDWLFGETLFLRKLLMPGCLRDQGGMSLLMWIMWNNVERAQHIVATLLLHLELDCTDADLAAELVTLIEVFTLGDELGIDRYSDVLVGIDERALSVIGFVTQDDEGMDVDSDDGYVPMGLLEYVRSCRSEYRRVMIMRLVVSMYEADAQAWREAAQVEYPDGGRRWLLWAATCVEDFGKCLQDDDGVRRVWEDLARQVPGEREIFGVYDLEDRLLAAAESMGGDEQVEEEEEEEEEEGEDEGEGDQEDGPSDVRVITAHDDEGKVDEDDVAEIDLDK